MDKYILTIEVQGEIDPKKLLEELDHRMNTGEKWYFVHDKATLKKKVVAKKKVTSKKIC